MQRVGNVATNNVSAGLPSLEHLHLLRLGHCRATVLIYCHELLSLPGGYRCIYSPPAGYTRLLLRGQREPPGEG